MTLGLALCAIGGGFIGSQAFPDKERNLKVICIGIVIFVLGFLIP